MLTIWNSLPDKKLQVEMCGVETLSRNEYRKYGGHADSDLHSFHCQQPVTRIKPSHGVAALLPPKPCPCFDAPKTYAY